MDSNRALLFGGVALAVILGIFSLGFAAWAAFDDHDDSAGNGWWGPGMMMNSGMMGPMMGSQSQYGYMSDHMRWMMGGFEVGNTELTQGSANQTIAMRNFAFSPSNVQVPVGATVTWKNEDDAPHIAAAADGSWSTVNLRKGESASVKFDKAGEYLYVCSYHTGMTGRLRVQ